MFEPIAEPALDIVRAKRIDLAQFAAHNHLTRLTHQRVARVVVRDGKDDADGDLGQLPIERVVAVEFGGLEPK